MSDSKSKENTSSRHIKDNKDKSLKLEKKNQEKFSQGGRNPLGTNLRKKVFK